LIRAFYLENEYGELYFFNHKNQTIITQASGLGFSLDIKYLEYNKYFAKTESNLPLTDITETLIFLKGYQGYKDFVDYLSRSKDVLKMHYETPAFKAYSYVDVLSLSKGELVASTIQSQIVFKKVSMWYKEKTFEIVANGNQSGKVYPYGYPYHYESSYQGLIHINNQGLDEAPINIEIHGSFYHPEVSILKNGYVISKMKLYVESDNASLKIIAIPSKQEITLIENGTTQDVYGLQDFQEDNFLFVNHGNYEIEFKPGVATKSICKVTLLEGYMGI
jgi:hypothetical protein